MFDGGSRKKISLGGRRDVLDKAALVDKARREREEREQARQRQAAASRIQAFWRSRNKAGKWRDQIRGEWDAAMKEEINAKNLIALTNQLLFISRDGSTDSDRWAKLCLAFLSHSEGFGPLIVSTAESMMRFLLRLVKACIRLIHVEMKKMEKAKTTTTTAAATTTTGGGSRLSLTQEQTTRMIAPLRLIRAAAAVDTWSKLMDATAAHAIASAVANVLADFGHYRILRTLLTSAFPQQQQQATTAAATGNNDPATLMITVCINLGVRMLSTPKVDLAGLTGENAMISSPDDSSVGKARASVVGFFANLYTQHQSKSGSEFSFRASPAHFFCWEILSIPRLFERLPNEMSKSLRSAAVWKDVLENLDVSSLLSLATTPSSVNSYSASTLSSISTKSTTTTATATTVAKSTSSISSSSSVSSSLGGGGGGLRKPGAAPSSLLPSTETTTSGFSENRLLCLLANLVRVGEHEVANAPVRSLTRFLHLAASVLSNVSGIVHGASWVSGSASGRGGLGEEDDDEESAEGGGGGAAAASSTFSSSSMPPDWVWIKSELARMVTLSYVRSLTRPLIDHGDHKASASTKSEDDNCGDDNCGDDNDSTAVVSLSCVLVLLCSVFPDTRADTLNGLACVHGALRRLWDWLASPVPIIPTRSTTAATASPMQLGSSSIEKMGVGSNTVSIGAWAVLALFCMGYDHTLVTLDDEEFRSETIVFRLNELAGVISSLKSVIYRCFWNPVSIYGGAAPTTTLSSQQQQQQQHASGPSPLALYESILKRHGSSLLSRLLDRNVSLQFTDEKEWMGNGGLTRDVLAAIGVTPRVVSELLLGDDDDNDDNDYVEEPDQMEDELVDIDARSSGNSVSNMRSAAINREAAVAILKNVPFMLSFKHRVSLFRRFVNDNRGQNMFGMHGRNVTIRRGQVLMDAFSALNDSTLKERIQIQFIDQQGLPEAGIDGGGLFKEFLTALTKEAYDPQVGLFVQTEQGGLYPNPASQMIFEDHLRLFRFLGRILGKALFDGILVELPLAPFFLNKLLGRTNFLSDLKSLDPSLYRSLLFLKTYDGDFADLALTFTVTDDVFGSAVSQDLIPNGSSIAVDAQNRFRFIYLVSDYWLNRRIRVQSQAFMHGLQEMVPSHLLRLFHANELQLLVSGSTRPIDVDDWRSHTVYSGGYSADHAVIAVFWRVVESFNADMRRKLLKFATSCSREPLLGFGELQPLFCVHYVPDEGRLPTASTCINMLKLPAYSSEETLREKLTLAICSGAGFDLS